VLQAALRHHAARIPLGPARELNPTIGSQLAAVNL
jgi:hypothetical protein